jgi:large subunit ribosomal protein L34
VGGKTRVIHSFVLRRENFTRDASRVALTALSTFALIAGFPGGTRLVHAADQRPLPLVPFAKRRHRIGWACRPAARRPPLPADRTMKRTYQASKVRRARTHGFLVRMKSRGGRAVINARRAKGRKRLSV